MDFFSLIPAIVTKPYLETDPGDLGGGLAGSYRVRTIYFLRGRA